MRRSTFLWLLVILLWQTACRVPRQPVEDIEFTILQINDVYEIAPLEGGKAGGLARVATVKKELMRENPNTIAVLSGDFLSPSLTGMLKDEDGQRIAGRQMVETLNVMGLDYATFGNHEFDISDPDVLQERLHQSDFRYVCCNVLYRTDEGARPFTEEVGGRELPIQPYLIHEFVNAKGTRIKVGILGVLLPFNQQPYLEYLPVVESFREAYRELRPQVDVVIALTHLAEDEDIALAREVPGIPLFLGGHDHNNMSHYVENTIITKADANAKTVYIHRVTYNPLSRMTRVRSTLKSIDDSIADDPATDAMVDKWQDKTAQVMTDMGYQPDRPVMVTNEPLECTEYKIRSRQTNFGKLTTESFEYCRPGADVYFLNSGSMRLDDDIAGTVTEYDILRTYPFGGKIVEMELPGEVLARTLQTGMEVNRGEGGYFQLNYAEKKQGRWRIQGQLLDPARSYKVVLPEFVAQGRESNLDFLGDYEYTSQEEFNVDGQAVRNDIRDIVIAYMLTL